MNLFISVLKSISNILLLFITFFFTFFKCNKYISMKVCCSKLYIINLDYFRTYMTITCMNNSSFIKRHVLNSV